MPATQLLPHAGRPGAAPRPAVPLRQPGPFQVPVQLELGALPLPLCYAVVARWEERCYGEVLRTTVEKEVTLHCAAHRTGLRLTWETLPPRLRKREPLALEEIMLVLAGLYRRLVLDISTTGEVLALANHDEILETWAGIEQELVARYGAAEPLTAGLRAGVAAQVREPARLLASLRHDYAYHLLLANLYGQRFESGLGYEQARVFPHFLPDTALAFQERLMLGAATALGQAAVLAQGRPDETGLDRPAVARQVAARLALFGPAVEPDPATLAFGYQARHDLDLATGWPVRVAATASCHSPSGYAKEYDLTIDPL